MSHAKLESSERLQRVYEYLSDGEPHSTRDIIINADVCAVNSCIDELRSNGKEIRCKRNGKVFEYTLLPF